MGSQADSAGQIIVTPQGGGSLNGLGEKFSPDLYTGTGNFSVPITVPRGRDGLEPKLTLSYSTGSGNGHFGLGWSLSVPGVARKTSKGIPIYDDTKDVFVLSGSEDLVPIDASANAAVYRPRTEGLFARITHFHADSNNYWEVRTRDGLISLYGTPGQASGGPASPPDPAAITDPNDSTRVFTWKLSSTRDPFGNLVQYKYSRDRQSMGPRTWDQLYLSEIQYADYGNVAAPSFLAQIDFTYDGPVWRPGQTALPATQRLDAFSHYRAGFEVRTTKRCTQINVSTDAQVEQPVRTYHLLYQDQLASIPVNGASLLAKIAVEGQDGTDFELLPPLEFGYSSFTPAQRRYVDVSGAALPAQSLADPSTDLVDIHGQGLPDILQMSNTTRYWKNLGSGRFGVPRPMQYAPAGIALANPGVQIVDANGDGRPDLLITTTNLSGYFPLQFGGEWSSRSFQPYRVAPSFNLKDPQVHLVDLNGDGITDAIRSGTSMECYFNDAQFGWVGTKRVQRGLLENFPNVNFSDPRVKWADMTGDGLQDIALVYDGVVQYWPNLGYGNWGKRITMVDNQSASSSRPDFPFGYDPKRILLGDVDGDGAADLIYVDDLKITIWFNQTGNRWSQPVVIEGTPPVTDTDSVRLVDLMGNGVSGILWTSNLVEPGRPHMFFLDLTGGTKPYLLNRIDNHMGSVTTITYKPSTWYYLQDDLSPDTRWITPLPFPVQVVASTQSFDQFSACTLTSEFIYHHGYWDGYEREFRGFGRVHQRDSQTLVGVPAPQSSTPPTETRTWFHQGAIGDSFQGWTESDADSRIPGQHQFTEEYFAEPWPGTAPNPRVLARPEAMIDYIAGFTSDVRRDAFRSMRGKMLRTELYALDGSTLEDVPYTVTEHVYGVRQESVPVVGAPPRPPILFPFELSQRSTQWERGVDPLSTFVYTDNCTLAGQTLTTADFDPYGQALGHIDIAVGRGRVFQTEAPAGNAYLTKQATTTYAQRDDNAIYIIDRASSSTLFEVPNDGSMALIDFVRAIQAGQEQRNVVAQTISYFDGSAYVGLPFGQIGSYGAVSRTEAYCFTSGILQTAYGNLPPYLVPGGLPNWTAEYPQGFRILLPALAGYTFETASAGSPYLDGYYRLADQRKYDFQEEPVQSSRGLVTGKKDALGNETTIVYDTPYQLLPVMVTNPAKLVTHAAYDYRVLQPAAITDVNGNQTSYTYSPLGLLSQIIVAGQDGQSLGDTAAAPGTQFSYTLMGMDAAGLPVPIADLGQPTSTTKIRRVHHVSETDVPEPMRDQIIQSVEFSDGFGRILQTRTQAEAVLFDALSPANPQFGDAGLPTDQTQPGTDAVGQQSQTANPFVAVSGWQAYDNKGQVVEKYEPFFSTGWEYAEPQDAQLGEKATLYYDPRGHVIRTVNPDGSEQRVLFGVPGTISAPDFTNPDVFEPTPWESYTYDADDNAGRTHPGTSTGYQQCWNTPSSVQIDALGRTVLTVERNRTLLANGTWSTIVSYGTASTYDIVGNLLSVEDALGRTAFNYVYDLIQRPLCNVGIDSGTRASVPDAAGNTVEQRESNGALILHAMDVLNRPIRLWARDASEAVTLRQKIIYGDNLADSGMTEVQALAANLMGKPYKHYDEAGLMTCTSYDFKGNLLEKTRNVITEAALLAPFAAGSLTGVITPFRVDWSAADQSFLDTASTYQTTSAFDALNRIKTAQYPIDTSQGRKILVPQYNNAGALESVQLDGATYVDRIAYNAKGQRILISYGNGFMTRYAYDEKTFRLLRMRTEQYTLAAGTTTYRPSSPANPLQDLGYDYDLAGNLLTLHDRTPGSGIQNTVLGSNALDREFVYEPVYRLISATGRECDVPPPPPPWDDTPRCVDLTKTRAWSESYQYDNVGNMLAWKHNYMDASGTSAGNSRQFTLSAGSDRVATLAVDANTSYQYAYDSSGNQIQENTDRHYEWDAVGNMRVFRIQPANAVPSVYAQYLYDAGGQRVMKLVRNQSGGYQTTIYIEGVFERQRSVTNAATVDTTSLHVMDGQKRVAISRVGPAMPGDTGPPLRYHFGDHLGSSNVVVDGTGAWINREEYLPYGETSFGSFARKRYRFTGKERDEESGLSYHGARYYAPWLARWICPDPKGAVDGLNLYGYVHNCPMKFIDASGMEGASPPANQVSNPQLKQFDESKQTTYDRNHPNPLKDEAMRKYNQSNPLDRKRADSAAAPVKQAAAREEVLLKTPWHEQVIFDISERTGGNDMARAYTGASQWMEPYSPLQRATLGAKGVVTAASWAAPVAQSVYGRSSAALMDAAVKASAEETVTVFKLAPLADAHYPEMLANRYVSAEKSLVGLSHDELNARLDLLATKIQTADGPRFVASEIGKRYAGQNVLLRGETQYKNLQIPEHVGDVDWSRYEAGWARGPGLTAGEGPATNEFTLRSPIPVKERIPVHP